MRRTGRLAAVAWLAGAVVVAGCDYVVVPPESSDALAGTSEGWSAVPTAVETTAGGDLVVHLAIQNDTGLWSTMAAADEPARLTGPGGSADCDVVRVGTGGHRVAPGLRIRGYQAGTRAELETEPIRVECAGAAAETGSTLAIDYRYATGDYNYYDPDASVSSATLEVPLDPVATELAFPIGEPVDGVVEPSDASLAAINGMAVRLAAARRTDAGLELDWEATNPGEYPSTVHIGIPPVVGADGVVYGFWESPDLASAPVIPPGEAATWSTTVAVPPDVAGLYLLLSVENGKARLFANHLLDLTGL